VQGDVFKIAIKKRNPTGDLAGRPYEEEHMNDELSQNGVNNSG